MGNKARDIFATCLNCIDGRTHQPIISWITGKYPVDYVDLITEPGMAGLIGHSTEAMNPEILDKVLISVSKHSTRFIFVAAHHDCAANPVDDKEQAEQVTRAVKKLKEIFPSHTVAGLWVDQKRRVKKIS